MDFLDRFGKVNITKGNDDRTYYVSGKQDGRTCSDEEKGRQNGDFVSINGTLTVVSKTKLIFNGTIITKVYHINNGQECVREGQFTFEFDWWQKILAFTRDDKSM